MFPRNKRLKRADFPGALKAGKRLSSPHFLIIVPLTWPTPGVGHVGRTGGYAVVVSKKTARLSVTRHRIKRRVLAALRTLPSPPPSLIVYPKSSVLDLSFVEIKTELSALLSKTGL